MNEPPTIWGRAVIWGLGPFALASYCEKLDAMNIYFLSDVFVAVAVNSRRSCLSYFSLLVERQWRETRHH